MAAEPKTRPTAVPLETFIAGLAADRQDDVRQLAALMGEVTGEAAVVWGSDIVGFGQYRQCYADGRQMPWPLLGFSPRAKELSLYVMDGVANHQALLDRLGRHRTGRSCLYVRRLSDVSLPVLRQLFEACVAALEPLRIR